MITPDTYVVSEGANTMDIGRVMMPNQVAINLWLLLHFRTFVHASFSTQRARHRLDAGTFGTMGLGPGFAIATALYVR